MCSYCGCETEGVIAGLMADHAEIADLVYKVVRALDDHSLDEAAAVTSRLADAFARHSLYEEAGLFTQLQSAGEATGETEELIRDHRRLRAALSADWMDGDPRQLRQVLADLTRHAEVEDNDLFPFAMQRLPNSGWSALAADSVG